ncbi:membrane protein [Rhodovulum sp. P5]|nr:DUF2306 domain-containing protein [Rhodovulum sp. P5]ARE41081.1 membrane protein [Rhodovulum sp. P5]
MTAMPSRQRVKDTGLAALSVAAVVLLILGVWWFVAYSVGRGLSIADPEEQATRLFHAGAPVSNVALYGHMVVGGLLTCLAPLQLLGLVWRRVPWQHRALGYAVASLALGTGVAGLVYIAQQGTIGGPLMNAGFGLYGALMVLAALQTVRLARRRDPAHRDWALRLVVLALGSWLFRVHYGLWVGVTGGAAMTDDFRGAFDRVQTFAFYLPYLALLELYLRLFRRRDVFRPAPTHVAE